MTTRADSGDRAMTPSSGPPVIDAAQPDESEQSAVEQSTAIPRGSVSADELTATPAAPAPARTESERLISRSDVVSRARDAGPWWRHPLLALAVVLAAIVTVAVLAKRFVPAVRAASGGALRVVARVHLAPRQSVVLLQVGRRLVLAGVTPDRIGSLCVLDDPEETAEIIAAVDGPASERGRRFAAELTAQRGPFFGASDGASTGDEQGDDPALTDASGLDGSRRQLQMLLESLRGRSGQPRPVGTVSDRDS